MFKLFVALNLFISSMGGVTYGETSNAERVPPKTTRQAAGQVETLLTEGKKENRNQTGGGISETAGKESKPTAAGTSAGNYIPGNPGETVQKRLGSRKEDREFLAQGKQRTTSGNTSTKNPGTGKAGSHSNPSTVYLGAFTITAYTAGYESTQKKKGEPGYGITATGTTVAEGRTIAADWAVLPPGTVVQIEGLDGTYTVEDRGGAVNDKHIDLYISSLARAQEWGRQQRSVWVVKWGLKK